MAVRHENAWQTYGTRVSARRNPVPVPKYLRQELQLRDVGGYSIQDQIQKRWGTNARTLTGLDLELKPAAIDRTAAAINQLRPDWPIKSLRTLLEGHRLRDRPWADVTVALTWIATDPTSRTPARVLEAGPWWRPELVSEADQSPAAVPLRDLCWTCSRPASQHPLPGCETHTSPPPAIDYDAAGVVDELRDRVGKAQREPAPTPTSTEPDPRAVQARQALTRPA